MESVLIRPEMGQIASKLRQLDTKNGLSSVPIQQVGTRSPEKIACIIHPRMKNL
jgi:hypothetical protein